MTPAEFEGQLQDLGLKNSFIAKKLGLKIRTIQNWSSLKSNYQVPKEVSDFLKSARELQKKMIENGLKVIEDIEKKHNKNIPSVALRTFRTDEELWSKISDMQGWPKEFHLSILIKIKNRAESENENFTVDVFFHDE